MDVIKASGQSILYLFIGLIILVSSVAFSYLAVYQLEGAYAERVFAIESQDIYDDLAKKVKNWALVSHSSAILGTSEDQRHLFDMRRDLELSTRKLLQRAARSPEQTRILSELLDDISELTRSTTVLNLNALKKIDINLDKLIEIENSKSNLRGIEILTYINRLTATSGVTLALALLLIVYSIWAKRREDNFNIKLIQTLQSLKQQAESASELKSKFLSTVSHEIRTPLNGIIGISDILTHATPAPSDKSLAKTINQSGKTLLRIINDILDFSKIEAGKIELINYEFSIMDVLNQVLLTLSPKASEKSINLNYEIKPGIPARFTADSERLAQVLFNLIGNAIKFTQVGGVVVRVAPKNRTSDVAEIEFSISDTGVGMSADEIQNLFKPFVQLRKVGTSGEAGTGLGLSISQSIIQAMGGEIHVESSVGHGSTFTFTIPFQNFSSEVLETMPTFRQTDFANEAKNIEPLNMGYHPRVLVAEDNPTNQIVAQSMLSRLGVETIIASNGQEALKILESSQVDIILMDCQMPILDGFETARTIRKSGNNIPIVAMTANAFNQDEERCLAAGMNGFVSKPVDIFILREKLAKYLPERRAFTNLPLISLDSAIGVEGRKKVVRAFLSTTTYFKDTFRRSLAAENLQELKNLGHRFKGSSQTVGSLEFLEYCKGLESTESLSYAKDIESRVIESIENLEDFLAPYSV